MRLSVQRVRQLTEEEWTELGAFVRGLDANDWSAPSLCAGWTVRDVVSHVVGWDQLVALRDGNPLGYARALTTLGVRYALAGFSTDRFNARMLAKAGPNLLPAFEHEEPRRLFDRMAPGSHLAEYVVHHQDIRRALDRPRTIQGDRLVAALDGLARLPGVNVKKRAKGLRLRATDVEWSYGKGATPIEAPGESLLMALAGRIDFDSA